jgi:D-galactarolactone cycloisomerase
MKIVDIETIPLASRYDKPIRFAHMDLTEHRSIVVRIRTDEGIVGISDLDGPPAGDMALIDILHKTFKPMLIGKDPRAIGARDKEMFALLNTMGRYRSLESYVRGAIDIALWDILGKTCGQPIHVLLGSRRSSLPAYASMARLEPNEVAETVGRYGAEGFAGIKLRVGFDERKDTAVLDEARRAVPAGRAMRLMVDVNSAWRRAWALPNAQRLEKYELAWIEEPLPPYDIPGSAHLAANLVTPLALGEHEIFTLHDARDYILAGAADIIQPDLRQGISEVLRIANFAAAWDIPCIPHFFGPGLRFAATIQLLAAISNAELCEYPTTNNPLRFELMDQPLAAEKGVVSLPTGPGLGVSLNEKTLARYRID